MNRTSLYRQDDNHRLAERMCIADTPWRRLVGLLDRQMLPDHEALLLSPGSSIHTLGMKFSIDVLFIDSDRKVLKTIENLSPGRFQLAPPKTRYTVELAAGRLAHFGLLPGQRLRWAQ